jgi:hypothetical protein
MNRPLNKVFGQPWHTTTEGPAHGTTLGPQKLFHRITVTALLLQTRIKVHHPSKPTLP